MENNSLISVILTSYNRPIMIQRAIESVLSQTYPYFELLIEDDGSNQETIKTISKYLVDPRIRFYPHNTTDEERKKEVRYSCLINEALTNHVKGSLITYITDDDQFLPDRFSFFISYFKLNPKARFVFCNTEQRNNGRVVNILRPQKGFTNDDIFRTNPIDHNSVMHRADIVKQLLGRELGLWPTQSKYWTHADWIFWRRVSQVTKLHYLDKTLTIKNLHPYTVTSLMKQGKLFNPSIKNREK